MTCAGPDGATPTDDRTTPAADRLGIVRDAAVVVADGRVAWVGPAAAAPAADRVVDVGGRAVVPGFVDSHSHLVFAGDRAAEFTARMAGDALRRWRHRRLGGRHPGSHRRRAARAACGPGSPRCARQGTTTVEIKSGYGLTVERRGALTAPRPRGHRRDDLPRRPRRAARVPATTAAAYVDLVVRADAGGLRAVRPLGRRLLRAGLAARVHRGRGAARCSTAGRDAGLGLRVHGNQLSAGPGVRLAVELGAASVDHCTFLTDADVDALVGCGRHHGGHPAAREWSSRPARPTRTPAACSTPASTRAGDRLQPRHLQHVVDAVRHRAGGARDGADAGRGARGGDRGRRPGAASRRRRAGRRRGARRPGRARRAVVRAPGLPARGADRPRPRPRSNVEHAACLRAAGVFTSTSGVRRGRRVPRPAGARPTSRRTPPPCGSRWFSRRPGARPVIAAYTTALASGACGFFGLISSCPGLRPDRVDDLGGDDSREDGTPGAHDLPRDLAHRHGGPSRCSVRPDERTSDGSSSTLVPGVMVVTSNDRGAPPER